MLPGKGCAGIGAVTIGVLIPVRSQWRQAYLNRTFCKTFCLHLDMKLLGNGLAHAMQPATTARTGLLIIGKIILDALAWQVFRQGLASALLAFRLSGRWQPSVRQIDGINSFAAVVALACNLLGLVEDTISTLFAARRIKMQPCQRQFFLKLKDAFG